MKKLSDVLLPLGLICLLGACGIAVLSTGVIFASSVGFDRPFFYFQYLSLPAFYVALPIIGILALLPLALRLAFAREESAEKDKAAELEKKKGAEKEGRGEYHLKHA